MLSGAFAAWAEKVTFTREQRARRDRLVAKASGSLLVVQITDKPVCNILIILKRFHRPALPEMQDACSPAGRLCGGMPSAKHGSSTLVA